MGSDRARLRHAFLNTSSLLLLIALLVAGADVSADEAPSGELSAALEMAGKHRREGNLRLAVEILEGVCRPAGDACPVRVLGELGATYFQANRFSEAEAPLREAYARSQGQPERALFANDLGNLSASRGHGDEAMRYYEEAQRLAPQNSGIAVSAGLNRVRLMPLAQRATQLQTLHGEIAQVQDEYERARYLVNLGTQARELRPPAARLAFETLTDARKLAETLRDDWLAAQALDGLAQLYEDRGRGADALKLNDQAIDKLRAEPDADLLIGLYWRSGRLLRALGREDPALQAYQLAVERIERVRQDIPVTYVDGRSSFRETLEPVYVGLAELLLRQAMRASGESRAQLLRRARDAVELIKQTELQDYLGDRCQVLGTMTLTGSRLPAGVAILYPLILEKQLALLVDTPRGIEVREVAVGAATLREKTTAFAAALRQGSPDYLPRARELYDLLLRPIEPLLAENKTDTLVVVPDGPLRLVPFAALHDGQRFVVSKYATSIAPGLSIGSLARPGKSLGPVLLAGLSEPGPVMSKLTAEGIEALTSGGPVRETPAVDLKAGLALPGVSEELRALSTTTGGSRLLDSEFTAERFRTEVGSGRYRVVHIASHAVFSSSAQSSFVLAYDEVLSLDELQHLLRTGEVESNPIDLLSLSACQTAEGDDRAPLGIAGAALRARAGSALGSLWPVDDSATKSLMVRFYELLAKERQGKAKALRSAQSELLDDPAFQHPFYWAPFILVGDWQ
jgi:CHAT domain-containing protein